MGFGIGRNRERILALEAEIRELKLATVGLSARLEKLEPPRPCPGARQRHFSTGAAYCEECRG